MQSILKKIILTLLVSLTGLLFFIVQPPTPVSEAESKTTPQDMESLENQRASLCNDTNSWSCKQGARILLAEIDKKISILARKNLPLYALRKFANPSPEVQIKLESAYKILQENDPKTDISPKYLLSLGKRIEAETAPLDDDQEFLAYVYIIRKLQETKKDMPTLQWEINKSVKMALINIDKAPKNISFSSEEVAVLEKVFERIGKNPWNIGHLQMMKTEISRESIGENTRFFRAYALAKMRNATNSRFISVGDIAHSKQKYSLSCEANSLRDLINYYRSRSGEKAIDEDTLLLMLPTYKNASSLIKSEGKSTRIWGDPDLEFVGNISGVQSSNPNKLSGYGIHALGILPLGNRALKSSGFSLTKKTFDQAEILTSLYKGNPVVFWYVAGSAMRMTPSQVSWKTAQWKNITGYIGEHTGIITGAEMDKNGNIVTLEFYEWRSETLQKIPFEIVLREAKWFDSALYAESL